MTRPGAHEVQLDLFLDYASNVDMYPRFQEYFRVRGSILQLAQSFGADRMRRRNFCYAQELERPFVWCAPWLS